MGWRVKFTEYLNRATKDSLEIQKEEQEAFLQRYKTELAILSAFNPVSHDDRLGVLDDLQFRVNTLFESIVETAGTLALINQALDDDEAKKDV